MGGHIHRRTIRGLLNLPCLRLCCVSYLLEAIVEADGLPAADAVYAEVAHRQVAEREDRDVPSRGLCLEKLLPLISQAPRVTLIVDLYKCNVQLCLHIVI